MASRHPVIRISIPTQVSYALGLAFQQSMINTLRRNNKTLSEDEQTRKIMDSLNIKEITISKSKQYTEPDTEPDREQELEELNYIRHIRERVNNSKCPASSSSDSGSDSGYDDDDDDDDQSSASSDEASRTQ